MIKTTAILTPEILDACEEGVFMNSNLLLAVKYKDGTWSCFKAPLVVPLSLDEVKKHICAHEYVYNKYVTDEEAKLIDELETKFSDGLGQ